jgi:hypothetical protein
METRAAAEDARHIGRWLALAVGSLILAGLFSLTIVIARMPPFDRLVSDPGFFKRCLVVHVDLALVVWFYAFLAALFHLVPGAGRAGLLSRHGALVTAAGVLLLVVGAGVPGAEPVLSNYVPAIDHPVFVAGLAAVLAGLALAFADGRLLPGRERAAARVGLDLPPAARVAVRAGALLVLVAIVSFAAAASTTPGTLPAHPRFERIFWGGGHVLQLASVAGMLAVWLTLTARATGTPPLGRGAAAVLFGLFTLPALAAPMWAAADDRLAFTRLMQFGIFPTVLVVMAACLRALAAARRARAAAGAGAALWRDPGLVALASSMALTLAGFAFGAMIRGQNTVVPGHYHASIGAVTVSYMAITVPLLAALGLPLASPRWQRVARVQPALFGFGQLVFALGFVMAGAHGMARKTYGAEQASRSLGQTAGLVVMGLGGLVAVVGGLAYLGLVVSAWRARRAATDSPKENAAWTPAKDLIRSRG